MKTGYKVLIKKVFSDDTTEPITFTQDASLENAEVLLSASLSKMMYKPSSLEVEIQTERSIGDFRNSLITLSNEATIYAKDYFIFNIKLNNEKVILTAYSPDYFLTIDKFCQAFTAKTLIDGIIKPQWQGTATTQTDKSFVQFQSMPYGYRAAWKILDTYCLRFCRERTAYNVRNIIAC